MSKRKLLLFTTCLALSVNVTTAYAKQTLYELGRSPFNSTLTSVTDLQSMVSSQTGDIKAGFDLAEQPQLFDAFLDQIGSADIETVQMDKGSTMLWMVFKKNGKVKISRDITWGADEPFSAFSFPVDYQGKRYNMIFPLKCANMTLVSVSDVPAEPAPAVEPPAPVEPQPAEEPFKNLVGVFDVGYMYEGNSATYLPFRFGAEYRFDKNFSVMGLLGGAPKLGDTDGASGYLIDVIASYRIDRFSMGLGLGGWLSSGNNGVNPEGSRLDAIAELGYRLFGEDNSANTELYIEGRSGVDEFDDFDKFYRVSAGLRFRF